MTAFQIIAVILLCGLVAASVRGHLRGRMSRRTALGWIVLWLGAIVAIIEPRTTVRVARLLGIARGADLVMYCAILATGAGFFVVYNRLRQMETSITRIVRHVALREARERDAAEAPRAPLPGSDA